MTSPANSAVVIDTMVVSSLLNASADRELAKAYRTLIGERPVVVSFVTVTELRYGAMKAGWGELRRRSLERDLGQWVIVQPDDDLMRTCAELRDRCERRGHALGQKIHEADRWIAATALRLHVELVSDDHIFDEVSGLTVLTTGP